MLQPFASYKKVPGTFYLLCLSALTFRKKVPGTFYVVILQVVMSVIPLGGCCACLFAGRGGWLGGLGGEGGGNGPRADCEPAWAAGRSAICAGRARRGRSVRSLPLPGFRHGSATRYSVRTMPGSVTRQRAVLNQAHLARGSGAQVQGQDGPATHGQDARATTQPACFHLLTPPGGATGRP